MNATPPKVIYLVIGILGVIAVMGILSLCLTMFFKNYADPAVLTSIISITSGSIGSLGTMLVSTRSQPGSGTTTSTVTMTSEPRKIDTEPSPVIVANTPDQPVPVEATHEN